MAQKMLRCNRCKVTKNDHDFYYKDYKTPFKQCKKCADTRRNRDKITNFTVTDITINRDIIVTKMIEQNNQCYYCHRDFEDSRRVTLARLDENMGYSRDNIVLECSKCDIRDGPRSIQLSDNTQAVLI